MTKKIMKSIKNALISTGNNSETKLVSILFDEKIRKISETEIEDQVDEEIDLKGKLLIPGCIDAHVHFNDPGFNHHEDFLSGTTAAAYGGITTIIDMPCTSIPPVTNKKNLYQKFKIIQSKALIDFAFWGGIRRNDFPLSEEKVKELWKEGVVGFKIYTISGMETFSALTYKDIEKVFRQFPEMLFAFHAEDVNIIQKAINSFSKEELKLPENYVKIRPVEAEIEAVRQILEIAENNKIHFVHISTKIAAELILKYKKNINVTFETCPHFLEFTANDYQKLLGRLKTTPPVKFEKDKKYLQELLKKGKIDFITTDHAGCDFETEKKLKDFSKIYSGIPGTELMIPYLFSEFYLNEKVPLSTMIKMTSENAAGRFGFYPQKGSLEIGTDADFTVIDLNKIFTVDETKLRSLGKYSPFNNYTFNCSIDKTIVRGNTVFDADNGICQKPGFGRWIRRKATTN